MPRAFLITHRRYNGAEEEFEESGRGYSPERGVRVADYSGGHPTSDGASECGSETSSECPEELYNLTKLAEVSLAAAAGTLIHPSNVIYERPVSPRCTQVTDKCNNKVAILRTKSQQQQQQQEQHQLQLQQQHQQQDQLYFQSRQTIFDEDRTRDERTRLFFERIESEREILEGRTESTVLEVRLSSPTHLPQHRYAHHQRESHQRRESSEANVAPEVSAETTTTTTTATTPLTVSSITASTTAQPRRSGSASTEPMKIEESEDHECPDCGKKYSTSSNLARHRQTHRSLGDKKARRCPHCDKVYVSMPAFSMHVRTHNQGCKCHYCGKCFSRPWLLQGHIRTHTGEKPFKCTICNKAFADKSNLRAHIQTHSNTKPHVCGRCGKAFALKSYLYKHEESACMRAHHRTTAEKGDQVEQKTSTSSASRTLSNNTVSSSMSRLQSAPCVTASPTSVIVPRLDLNCDQRNSSSAFSAIIRHTRTSEGSLPTTSPIKRPCKEKFADDLVSKSADSVSTDPDCVSRMVIRTSVISPNPEHLGRFGNETKKSSSSFDYSNSSRTSAFPRPTTMTLNLAIA